MNKIVCTDGDYKNTLAIVRLLGKKGFEVSVISEKKHSLAAKSKWCRTEYVLGSPGSPGYLDKLEEILIRDKIDLLLPVGYVSHDTIIKNKKRLAEHAVIPTVEYDTFKIAANKDKTADLARFLEIPVPGSYRVDRPEDFSEITDFPVVIKASEEGGSVCYAHNPQQLSELYEKVKSEYAYHTSPPLIQEYIPGCNGYGFFAFYWKGTFVSGYCHQRVHMYPPTGGPSTMCKTIENGPVKEYGKKLLDALEWHGVAMVEFKQHEVNGEFYLMEINPKYWGSLDCGIAAGSLLPYYHAAYALGIEVDVKEHKKNALFFWPEYDLQYVLSARHKILELARWFVHLFTVKSTFSFFDPKPSFDLVFRGIKKIFKLK